MISKRLVFSFLFVSVAITGHLSPSFAEEMLYVGFKHAELFSRCAMTIERIELDSSPDSDFMAACVVYHLAGHEQVTVAVYDSVERARRAFNYWRNLSSIGGPPPPEGTAIGDEMTWGGGSSAPAHRRGATIMFRRGNIVFRLLRQDGEPSAVDLARQIDNWIQNDRAIAPLGTFDPPPEIVDAGIPATLAVRPTERRLLEDRPWPFGEPARTVVRINPQFRGLGPVENIRLRVEIEGLGSNQVGQDGRSRDLVDVPDDAGRISRTREKSAEHDGRFLLELHRLPSGRATRKVKMIAANADNVIVTREFEIEVVPGE